MKKPCFIPRLVVFTVFLSMALGCGPGSEEKEVRRVYDRLLETVRSSDGGAMFEMARPEFKMMMEELANRLTDVDDSLEIHQARLDRSALERKLYFDLLRFPIDGKELFRSLVNFKGIGMGPSVEAGLAVSEFVRHGQNISVITRSGESFVFSEDTKGSWNSTLPEQAFESWENRAVFLDNLGKVEDVLKKLAEETSDEKE